MLIFKQEATEATEEHGISVFSCLDIVWTWCRYGVGARRAVVLGGTVGSLSNNKGYSRGEGRDSGYAPWLNKPRG